MSTAQRLRRQTARRQAHTPTTRPPNAPAKRTSLDDEQGQINHFG
jgi:hypothetical protein